MARLFTLIALCACHEPAFGTLATGQADESVADVPLAVVSIAGPLRQAIQDLAQSFVAQYPDSPTYLARLAEIEQRAAADDRLLGKIKQELISLQRETFVANHEGPGDSISRIDVAARKELRRISLESFRGPHGIATSRDGDFACFMRSSDGGKTWSTPEFIARAHNESSIVVLPGDELLAVMRDMAGGLSQSRSRDKGRTWSAPRPMLAPGQHPADVIRLASGRLLAVFGRRKAPLGVQAIWSDDGGETWSLPRRAVLEGKSVNTDCGYPSSVQLADGTIVTMYYGVAHRERTELNQYAMIVRYRESDLAGLAVSEEAP